MAPNAIILGVTGCREVSAFYLSDLAKTAGMPVESFLLSMKDSDELLFSAKRDTDPIGRMEACHGGDESQCFHSLLLEYPDAVREEVLLS